MANFYDYSELLDDAQLLLKSNDFHGAIVKFDKIFKGL